MASAKALIALALLVVTLGTHALPARLLVREGEGDDFTITFAQTNYSTTLIRSYSEVKGASGDEYVCARLDLAHVTRGRRLLITRIEAHIEPPVNGRYIHHIAMYGWEKNPREQYEHMDGEPWDCFGPTRPTMDMVHSLSLEKRTVLPRGKGIVLPTNAFIQMHYKPVDIMGARVPLRDSSGLRLTLTEDPSVRAFRQFVVGPRRDMLKIPRGMPLYKVASVCAPTCLSSAMAREGVDTVEILAIRHHMHAIGRHQITEVIHPGGSVSVVYESRNFSMHSGTRVLDPPVVVRPGDALQTTCTYDSTSRAVGTWNGMSVDHEMCFSIMIASTTMGGCWHANLPSFKQREDAVCHAVCSKENSLQVIKQSNPPQFVIQRNVPRSRLDGQHSAWSVCTARHARGTVGPSARPAR